MIQKDVNNWYKFDFKGVGSYGMPLINPEIVQINKIIPFNYAKSCRVPGNTGVHFFLHDYQFERVWNNPERYMRMLRKFDFVCTPDFSLYMDYPLAMQIYNHYRKQWLGAYWQAFGLQVVPTVSWSNEDSYKWCFDGLPDHGAVAISSVGCLKNENTKANFLKGYKVMRERLKPEQILFYGNIPGEIADPVIRLGSFQEKFNEIRGKAWAEEVQ